MITNHRKKDYRKMKITVIGAGNMGGALVKGWAKAVREGKAALEVTATARTEARLKPLKAEYPEVNIMTDNRKAAAGADVLVMAVKPWLLDEVLSDMNDVIGKDCLVLSVAANVTHPRVDVYAMPNIAAEYGQSMTFVRNTDASGKEALDQAVELLELVGRVMSVDAKQMQAGNMMAGCGIAYVMRMVRAMMEGGVEMGLYPSVAQQVAMQTMLGAVTVLEESGLHPEVAIDKVTTAGGLTIKGLNELDHAGFNSAVIRCLKAGLKN